MSKRAREILLRWGQFSNEYLEESKRLKDSSSSRIEFADITRFLLVSLLGPILPVVLFLFSWQEGDPSKNGLIQTSFFTGTLCSIIFVTYVHGINLAFAKIPMGIHFVSAVVATAVLTISSSLVLRQLVGSIVPFELFAITFFGFSVGQVLYSKLKLIPVKDSRTGITEYWGYVVF